MKKYYIKPAIETINADIETILAGSPRPNDLNGNGFNGYSQQGGEDEDENGLIDDM